jgi:hypothetical protein
VPSTFAPAAHTHGTADITGISSSFAAASHTHDAAAISSGVLALARIPTIGYTALSGVPSTFAPQAHTHSTADVVGLTASFSQVGHTHDYAASIHTHSTADIAGYTSLPAQGGKAGPLVTDGTAASWANRFSIVDPVLVQGAGMTLSRDTAAGSITVAFAGGTSGIVVSSATPQPLGTAAAGTSGDASRADHVHLMPSAADVGAAPASHSHDYVQVLNGLTGTVSITGGAGVTVSTASSSITIAAAGSFVLPTASASVLGGVKVGSGLTITDGVLAATGGGSLSGSVTIPASGDTQWPNTVILLKGDDGLLQDATGRAWTAVGSPSVSTSVKKFGSSSLAFPNSPLSYLSTARTSQLEVGTGDFTLEWWLHPTAYPSGTAGQYNSSIFGTRGDNGAASGLICAMNPAGKLTLFMDGGSQTWGLFAGTTLTTSAIPLNEWTHIALTRSGSTWRGFYNGQLEVTVTQSGTPSVGIGNITIGGDDSGERFVGYMDDVRYTRAVRYTSTFTPPTATYGTGTYAAAQTLPVVFS